MIDECYLILLEGEYRFRLTTLKAVRQWERSLVLLSATLPPCQVDELKRNLLIRDLYVVRKATTIGNHEYSVVRMAGKEDFELKAVDLCERLIEDLERDGKRDERMIIYVRTRGEAERICSKLTNSGF